jgi:hypothetical protein
VVRHKEAEYRGVIIGWTRADEVSEGDSGGSATSLTNKPYELNHADRFKYTVVLDIGDAHLHHPKLRNVKNMGIAEVLQTDLEIVKDERCVTPAIVQKVLVRDSPPELTVHRGYQTA